MKREFNYARFFEACKTTLCARSCRSLLERWQMCKTNNFRLHSRQGLARVYTQYARVPYPDMLERGEKIVCLSVKSFILPDFHKLFICQFSVNAFLSRAREKKLPDLRHNLHTSEKSRVTNLFSRNENLLYDSFLLRTFPKTSTPESRTEETIL